VLHLVLETALRNISINGVGAGLNGIRYLTAGILDVDGVSIYGFTGHGIDVNTSSGGNLMVKDSTITDVDGSGVNISSSGTDAVSVLLNRVSIQHANKGVDSSFQSANAWVSNCTLTDIQSIAVHAQAGKIAVENCVLTSNGVALQAESNTTIRLMNSDIFYNTTAFNCAGGGAIVSDKQNRAGNNATNNKMCLAFPRTQDLFIF
jgi:hypothetical protein